ncbi:MAG: trypsin-like serine protease [Clostridiales bacterium]|nr:trypsin-like serine protease [Clostridiales bacterium]
MNMEYGYYENTQPNPGNTNSGNPNPENPKSDKPRKKKGRIFLRILGFMGAALAFGIIAGAAASGYHYIFMYNKGGDEIIAADEDDGKSGVIKDDTAADTEDSLVLPVGSKIEGIITDVSDVVEKVMPSIVSITSTDIITRYDIFFGRKFNQETKGSGSGIIIGQSDSSILIVTNNHVVAGAEEISVEFIDDTSADAVLKGADSGSDLAILEVSIKDLSEDTLNTIKVARLGDSDKLRLGDMVIAIGNALGYGQSITVGYVSALDREITTDGITMNLIQTDAAINPGNSGGALINIYGEVIGINSLKIAGTNVEGMGYAIPISDAIPMINLLMNNKATDVTEMGFLGINVKTARDVTKDIAEQFKMPIGVFVNDVVENSPAEAAGLKSGHIIVSFNSIKIETLDDLLNVLSYSKPGDEVELGIMELQNGEYVAKKLDVTLGTRPKE